MSRRLIAKEWERKALRKGATMLVRVVKPQPRNMVIEGDGQVWYDADCVNPGREMRCPYGKPGEELWLAEPFSDDLADIHPRTPVYYRDDGVVDHHIENGMAWSPEEKEWYRFRYRPATQMPEHYTRLRLVVEAVDVMRVSKIKEEIAVKTGVVGFQGDREKGCKCERCALDDWWVAFQKDNGKTLWLSDPFVWVVSLRKAVG